MFYNNSGFYPYSTGRFSSLRPKINWGNLLSNTQKALGIINQSIPIFYQIKPIWNNAKMMFRIMGELKEKPTSTTKGQKKETLQPVSGNNSTSRSKSSNDNSPQFFL